MKPQRKLIVHTAQGWYESAYDDTQNYSMSERLLFMENALNHTENALFASREKLTKQEKYAELGRLASECISQFDCKGIIKTGCKMCCDRYVICVKYAELLAGEKND